MAFHPPTGSRAVLLSLALLGLAIATWLTLVQVDLLDTAWDPVFGAESTRRVLDLTHPVPDAAAGVLAYATEVLLLLPGGDDRCRTVPWACLGLGVVLTTGAVVSVALIVIQPAVAGAWCLLCLGSAALSLLLFALGIGEGRDAAREFRRNLDRGQPWLAALGLAGRST